MNSFQNLTEEDITRIIAKAYQDGYYKCHFNGPLKEFQMLDSLEYAEEVMQKISKIKQTKVHDVKDSETKLYNGTVYQVIKPEPGENIIMPDSNIYIKKERIETGDIECKCAYFACDLHCEDDLICGGDLFCEGNLICRGDLICRGNLHCEGNLFCDGNLHCEGNLFCEGNFHCEDNLKCKGHFYCNGNFKCRGNLNARSAGIERR